MSIGIDDRTDIDDRVDSVDIADRVVLAVDDGVDVSRETSDDDDTPLARAAQQAIEIRTAT